MISTSMIAGLILGALISRWIYLEYHIHRSQKESSFSLKNLHNSVELLLTELQRPLAGLNGIRRMFETSGNKADGIDDYTEIVDYCVSESFNKIDKARIYFDLTTHKYSGTKEEVNLHHCLTEAINLAKKHYPYSGLNANIMDVPEALVLTNVDPYLLKLLIYQSLSTVLAKDQKYVEFSMKICEKANLGIEIYTMSDRSQLASMTSNAPSKLEDMDKIQKVDLYDQKVLSIDERLLFKLCDYQNIELGCTPIDAEVKSQKFILQFPKKITHNYSEEKFLRSKYAHA